MNERINEEENNSHTPFMGKSIKESSIQYLLDIGLIDNFPNKDQVLELFLVFKKENFSEKCGKK